ncbi:MAG: DUF2332 family protein [Actinobacteria bacterium]|nr:DUF2332 family protein [Actinomycetota bacterium]
MDTSAAMPSLTGGPQERFAQYLTHMARGDNGSALYTTILRAAADDVRAGGRVWDLLADRAERNLWDDAPAIRLLGAVHHLVLAGRAPELDRFYPSAGGTTGPERVWPALAEVLEREAEATRALIPRPIQTNEVGRCAALIGGFLEAARPGLPLRVLEIGSSAGFNLRWDHYRYEARGRSWGPDSPVRLCSYNTQRIPSFDVTATVVERRGCDQHPVDPTTEEDRLMLTSFVWPDQIHRHRLLKAALEVAERVPVEIDRANAAEWLPDQLAELPKGTMTVVFHSMTMQYLTLEERDAVRSAIGSAGERATREAPLAWLRMEPGGRWAHVDLTMWPGGIGRRLARSGYHGDPVEWLSAGGS